LGIVDPDGHVVVGESDPLRPPPDQAPQIANGIVLATGDNPRLHSGQVHEVGRVVEGKDHNANAEGVPLDPDPGRITLATPSGQGRGEQEKGSGNPLAKQIHHTSGQCRPPCQWGSGCVSGGPRLASGMGALGLQLEEGEGEELGSLVGSGNSGTSFPESVAPGSSRRTGGVKLAYQARRATVSGRGSMSNDRIGAGIARSWRSSSETLSVTFRVAKTPRP
jgi:hypothetical protein